MMPTRTEARSRQPPGAQVWHEGLWLKADTAGRVYRHTGAEWVRSTRNNLPMVISKFQLDLLKRIRAACDRGALYAHDRRHANALAVLCNQGMIDSPPRAPNWWQITESGRLYLRNHPRDWFK